MEKQDAVRKIAANFLKMNEDAVTPDTPVNNKTVKGSVMLHRMYAVLSKELGFDIQNRDKVNTFGDLLAVCNLTPTGGHVQKEHQNLSPSPLPSERALNLKAPQGNHRPPNISVGIDMESIHKMPKVNDCRQEPFYTQNFSQVEISYCLLQPDPWQSFAGKFAAKEAVVKADNAYKGVPFSEIEITVDAAGKPSFRNFAISITHNDQYAVAVAVAY
jgi:holo-[acyl-carrier protein] synthase